MPQFNMCTGLKGMAGSQKGMEGPGTISDVQNESHTRAPPHSLTALQKERLLAGEARQLPRRLPWSKLGADCLLANLWGGLTVCL